MQDKGRSVFAAFSNTEFGQLFFVDELYWKFPIAA